MVNLELFVIIVLIQMAQKKALLETTVICESTMSNINCAGIPCSTLNITYANFGRTAFDICPHSNGNAMDCWSSNSTTIVRDICQERVMCTLDANNSIFGDPCSGVSKYLEVHFECTDTGYCSTALELTQTSSSMSTTTILPTVSPVTTNQIQISTDSYSETIRSASQPAKHSSMSPRFFTVSQQGSSYMTTTTKQLVTKKATATLRVGISETSTMSLANAAFVAATSSPLRSTSTVTTANIHSSGGFFADPGHIAMVSAVAGVVIIGTAAASLYAYFSHGGILAW